MYSGRIKALQQAYFFFDKPRKNIHNGLGIQENIGSAILPFCNSCGKRKKSQKKHDHNFIPFLLQTFQRRK